MRLIAMLGDRQKLFYLYQPFGH